MGANPFSGAVDEDGELWDADGVYVIDASVFPTATGANPMITQQCVSAECYPSVLSTTTIITERRRRRYRYHRTIAGVQKEKNEEENGEEKKPVMEHPQNCHCIAFQENEQFSIL